MKSIVLLLLFTLLLLFIMSCGKPKPPEQLNILQRRDCNETLYDIHAEYKSLQVMFESDEDYNKNKFIKNILNKPYYRVEYIDNKMYSILEIAKQSKKHNYNFLQPTEFPIFNWYYKVHNTSDTSTFPLRLLITGLNRSPTNLKNKFDTYKSLIYENIDISTYKALGLDKIIKNLLKTYELYDADEITKFIDNHKPDSDSLFVYFAMMYYDKGLTSVDNLTARYRIDSWFYSFWYRRYLEDNMEVVYEILRKIQAHYEKEE